MCVPVERVAPSGGWEARDSQVSVRLGGRFWILGGCYESTQENLREAWSSPDGVYWDREPDAPFRETDYPAAVVLGSRLYLLGGWADGRMPTSRSSSRVWSTADGREWTLETQAPGWSARVSTVSAAFNGRIWLMGEIEDCHRATVYEAKNDVWGTEDGVTWTWILEHAP